MAHAQGFGPATPDEDSEIGPASPGSLDSPDDQDYRQDPFPSSLSSGPQISSDSTRRLPSLRTVSAPVPGPAGSMSSSISGTLNNARRPTPSAGKLPLDLMQKARALQQQRLGKPPHSPHSPITGVNGVLSDGAHGVLTGGIASNLRMPAHLNRNMGPGSMGRPVPHGFQSAPNVLGTPNRRMGLSERRAMKLGPLPGGPGGSPGQGPSQLSDGADGAGSTQNSLINDFKHYIDAENGWVTFQGAATITRTGVDFAGGHTFKISLDEIEVLGELGKGNYGIVYKVRHAKPTKPRFGPGLNSFKNPPPITTSPRQSLASLASNPVMSDETAGDNAGATAQATSGKIMAMKEIRLELDEAKFTTILKELVILHECVSPYIIDFYGAFYQEGAVYICIEYMDGGSIDKLYAGGIPESILRKITYATIMGLKSLKDEHKIIHRDVKPTNILVNSRGQVKICDFGVSGNLVSSIAKTNIGCQSYMAPERISGGNLGPAGGANADGTYSVQSDIWSLGLTIIECAMGRYPYPPEVSSTIFSQLTAIVNGEPPVMPDKYSATAHDFVRSCLNKNPLKRHTYSMLLKHPWLKSLGKDSTIQEVEEEFTDDETDDVKAAREHMGSLGLSNGPKNGQGTTLIAGDEEVAAWVIGVQQKKNDDEEGAASAAAKPALHAAPLAP